MELRIENLSKQYPNGTRALQNVSLNIQLGMFGLLGPNGAGKSTLMRTLATLQEADSGRAVLGDIDVLRHKDAVRRVLGYLPQEFGLYPKVSAEDLLSYFAVLKGISNATERRELVQSLLQQTNLYDHRRKALGSFSGGMKQRVAIVRALAWNASILLMDEPFSALDALTRITMHRLVLSLWVRHKPAVLLVTHDVDEALSLCDRVLVLAGGQIAFSERIDVPRPRERDHPELAALRTRLLIELGVVTEG